MSDTYISWEDQFAKGPRPRRVFRTREEMSADYAAHLAERGRNIAKYGGVELSNEEFTLLNNFEKDPERYRLDMNDEDFALFNSAFAGERSNKEFVDNRYKFASAIQLARLYQVPLNYAWSHYDDILASQYDERVTKDPKTAFKAVSDSFRLGTNQDRVAAMGRELMTLPEGERRNKLWGEIQNIKKENEELGDGVTRGWFIEGLKGLGESWAFTVKSAAAGAAGGLINPALGVVSAAAVSSADMAGLEYVSLLDQGVDKDTALRFAWASGAIQGIIEAGLGDVAALGSRTGLGQLVFKRLHYSGKIGAVARVLMGRAGDTFMEGAEEAAQEFASQAFTELAKKETEEKFGIRLGRDTPEEKRRAVIENFKAGFFTSIMMSIPVAGKEILHNKGDIARAEIARAASRDVGEFRKTMRDTDNAGFRGLDEENFNEATEAYYSQGRQERALEIQAEEERLKKERLYGSVERADGETADLEDTSGVVYRDKDGSLRAIRNTKTQGGNGVTEGVYIIGNPEKAEKYAYMEIEYEVWDGKAEIENVRVAENFEGLYTEGLNKFAADIGQEVTWKGETFTPPEGAVIAPEAAGAAPLPEFTPAERSLDEGLTRVMPGLSEPERRANIELVKLHADYKNLSLEDYLNRYFQEGVFSDTGAGEYAAAQNRENRVKGAAVFDPQTGKALIAGSAWADASTAAHEFLHAFSRTLDGDDLAEYRRLFQDDEEAALSYEKYLETGEAPTEKLKSLFEKIKAFMRRIYELVKNSRVLSADEKTFWDGIFQTAETNRDEREIRDNAPGGGTNREGGRRAGKGAREPAPGTAGEKTDPGGRATFGLPPGTLRIRALDSIIGNKAAPFTERSDAAVEKAGLQREQAVYQDAPEDGPRNRDNPPVLFQDDAFKSFLSQNPSLIAYAAGFDSWQDFKDAVTEGWLNADEKARGLVPEAADDAWYQSVWESARTITEDRRYDETALFQADRNAREYFLDYINTDEGLEELFALIDAAGDPDFTPSNEEEKRIHEARKRVKDNVFINFLWTNENARGDAKSRHTMREMIRDTPLLYMNAYAVLSGNDIYLTEDEQVDMPVSLAPEREKEIRNASPEQLRRIAREISWKGVEEEIENGTLKRDDARIPEAEEENKEKQKEIKNRIAATIDSYGEDSANGVYEDWIKLIRHGIEARQKLDDFKSTPEGINETAKSLRKLKALELDERKARLEYGRFLSTLNQSMKQQFKGLQELYGELAHTEKALAAVAGVREIRKKQTKRVVRRPDPKTINLEQVLLIEGIQSYFSDWYSVIPRWIGPKAKDLRQLYNDFANNHEEYREKLRRKLRPEDFRKLERVIFLDKEKNTVKPYPELTTANRNFLYSVLSDNEKLFRDLGLDRIDDTPEKPSPEIYEKIKEILPADILYKLENLSKAEWTLEDMETLGSIISGLRDEGRIELKAKRDARKEITNRYIALFNREITGGKEAGLGKLKGIQSTEIEERKRAGIKEFIFSLMNARRFFRMLDGGRDRAFYEIIYQGEDQAYYNMTRHALARREEVDRKLKEAGIDIRDLWRVTFDVEFGERTEKVTLDEMLYFRRAGLNDRAWQAVVYGNFAGQNERDSLARSKGDMETFVSFEKRAQARYDKAMARLGEFLKKEGNEKFGQVEEIIGADFDGSYGRLKNFMAREHNQKLGSEKYYVPIPRLEVTGEINEQEVFSEVLSGAGYAAAASVEKGFTVGRLDIPPEYQKPVKTGLYKLWDGMVEKQERLMAYGPYVRMLRNIFEGHQAGTLRDNIKTKYSQAANDYIDKFIAYVANPRPAGDYDAMNTMTRLLRGNYPTAVLGWRLSSVIKQLVTSPPPFFQYVSIPEYIAAAGELTGHYKETMAMIREKSVYMKERVYDPSIEMVRMIEKAALEGKLGQAEALLNRLNKTGMKGLEMIDLACVAPGWLAAYKKKLAELEKNKSVAENLRDAEAVRFADQVVRDTQPSGRGVDLAPIFRDSKGIAKAFLQFQVPMSVIFQNLAFDVPAAIKNGRVHQLFITVAIYAMTAVAVGFMEDDDDDRLNGRDIAASAAGGLIESIPVVGGAAARVTESVIRGEKVRPTQWNTFPVLQSAEKGVNAIQNKKWLKALDTAVDAFFYATGLPAGLKNEVEKAREDGDWEILLGIK